MNHLKTYSRLIFIFCVVCSAHFASAATENIKVIDTSVGCFHSVNANHEFKFQDGAWVWRDAKITTAQVEKLRELVAKAPTKKEALLSEVGITAEEVLKRREEIIQTALPKHWKKAYSQLNRVPAALNQLLSYEHFAAIFFKNLTNDDGLRSTTTVEFSVTIPGTPPLTIKSNAEQPGMLPFRVVSKRRETKIYSFEVAQMLQMFADPKGPNYQLLNPQDYLANSLWKDDIFLRSLTEGFDNHFSENLYRNIDGYREIENLFKVTKADSGNFNSEPLSLNLVIAVQDKSTSINSIWCWIHLTEDGHPKNNWGTVKSLFLSAEAEVKKHQWLLDWKDAGPGRQIELQISGDHPYTEFDLKENASPAWSQAALEGTPEYRILLRKKGQWCGTLFLGSAEKSALVTRAMKSRGSSSFDKLEVGFPNYMIISPTGEFRPITVEKPK